MYEHKSIDKTVYDSANTDLQELKKVSPSALT